MARRPNATCHYCGEECYVRPGVMARQASWYCSKTCFERVRGRTAGRIAKPKPNCPCGSEVNTGMLYCSRECSGRYWSEKIRRQDIGRRSQKPNGYVQIKLSPDDPFYGNAWSTGWAYEHHLVLAREIGRWLHQGESVHHINGDRSDNRIENLQLVKRFHGNGQAWKCLDCGSNNVQASELESDSEGQA